jgi:hypothetical protein
MANGGYWNYRFVKNEVHSEDKVIGIYYDLYEVYYDENDKIIAWSEQPQGIQIVDRGDLKTFLKQIKKASKNKVLEIDYNGKLVELNEYIQSNGFIRIT